MPDLDGVSVHNHEHEILELEETKKTMMSLLDRLEMERETILAEKAQDEAVLSAIGEGLVVTDTKGRVVLANKAFEKLLCLSVKDSIGKMFVDLVGVTDKAGKTIDVTQRPITRVLNGETPDASVDLVYSCKERSIPVAVHVTPIMLNGKLAGAVEVFRDITKEQEIDREKSEFVTLASHQLRTPISIINWFSELLLDKKKNAKDSSDLTYLNSIYAASRRMGRLVNQLLNVSRADIGKLHVEAVPTDLVVFLKGVIAEVETTEQIMKQNCKIQLVGPTQALPPINFDPTLLQQVIVNLITNAIEYTPDSMACEVKITVHDPAGEKVVISIEDHGIGIPKDVQQKIFQRMFRAENAVKCTPNGNGLGLYLAKQIMAVMNGDIWFESEEGKGSTFFVSIPLAGFQK